jgi:hypothetical protein
VMEILHKTRRRREGLQTFARELEENTAAVQRLLAEAEPHQA